MHLSKRVFRAWSVRTGLFMRSDGCGTLLTHVGNSLITCSSRWTPHKIRMEYCSSGLHPQKSYSNHGQTHRGNANVERCSAKQLSVCTSGGCHQLTNARSVMKLCLIQRTGSSPSMFFQTSPDFCEQILQRGKKNLRCTSISSKGENQWEPRRYRTEPNLQQTRRLGRLGCSIPRCFIVMKHTSQHQVP